MKNQYVCDIGDFGKYLLLHYIVQANSGKSLSLGINWYFTPNDNKSDGKFVAYLVNDKNSLKETLAPISNRIYSLLQEIYNTKRSLEQIEEKKILPNTKYYSNEIKKDNRKEWIKQSLKKLNKADIIFLDPDNGIAFREKDKDLTKYIIYDDLKEYRKKTNSNLILYQHGFRPKGGLANFARNTLVSYIKHIFPEAKIRILWYHKGSARLYIFIIRKNKGIINNRINSFIKKQKNKIFTEIELD